MAGLLLLFTLLMSLPWLVPFTGPLALVGFVPLLIAHRLAHEWKTRRFFWYHYAAFVLWNAITTWWVWNATPGGAVFAILANALQMSVVFELFRFVKKRLKGVLPYIFLAAAWIAWEKYYLDAAQISWPWLVLGNAFAETTPLVQFYSVTGQLGGSLWVWVSNLSVFGLMVALSDGRMANWNLKARTASFAGVALAVFGPAIWSACIHPRTDGESLKVVIGQPNFDPYQKFVYMNQEQQDRFFLDLVAPYTRDSVLVIAPETFTGRFNLSNIGTNASVGRYAAFLEEHPGSGFLFGVSGYENGPVHRNSAVCMDSGGSTSVYHKSKLVVGAEFTPYPKVTEPIENLLGGNLMGKCKGQEQPSCLKYAGIPFGCAVCYESVYGNFCRGYVLDGARFLTVITNDAWWGTTPGYRQHFSYSRLRAIETGRYIARCGNTGLSGIIDPGGKVLVKGPWWESTVIPSEVKLLDSITPFVRYGDIVGRLAVFVFLLIIILNFVKIFRV